MVSANIYLKVHWQNVMDPKYKLVYCVGEFTFENTKTIRELKEKLFEMVGDGTPSQTSGIDSLVVLKNINQGYLYDEKSQQVEVLDHQTLIEAGFGEGIVIGLQSKAFIGMKECPICTYKCQDSAKVCEMCGQHLGQVKSSRQSKKLLPELKEKAEAGDQDAVEKLKTMFDHEIFQARMKKQLNQAYIKADQSDEEDGEGAQENQIQNNGVCEACTFQNEINIADCEMCGYKF